MRNGTGEDETAEHLSQDAEKAGDDVEGVGDVAIGEGQNAEHQSHDAKEAGEDVEGDGDVVRPGIVESSEVICT